MSAPSGSQPNSSHVQPSAEEPLESNEVAIELFSARLIDLESDESDKVIDICLLAKHIRKSLTEVQQTYHQHQTSLLAEVQLRQQVDGLIETSLKIQQFTIAFLLVLQELAIDFDTISGRDGFRTFMRSRFARRFCQRIYENQLSARAILTDCKLKLQFRTASNMIVDDFGAIAYYMSKVETYFAKEFKKYAMNFFTEKPPDDDIFKLQGMVCCMCFHGVRSLGRLFAHTQHLRLRLRVFEEKFHKIWLNLPEEVVNIVSYHLTFARDGLHTLRKNTMIVIALSMRFVHDDEDERFISYCRAQEERTAQTADNVYGVEGRIDELEKMIRHFTSDLSAESMKPSGFRRCTFTGDPLEKRIAQLDENLVQEGYHVLLVHDGSEDCTKLAYYLQSEIHIRHSSCYMEGTMFADSDVIMDQTECALDDAFVGVFLLTPEFAKRKGKVRQLQHMIHRVRTARVGWPGPTLIPVFLEVSIADCRARNIFGESSECMDDDIDKDGAEKAFHFITRYTGIENLEGAKVGNGEELDENCKKLMERIADGVAEVMLTTVKEYEELSVQEGNDETSEGRRANLENLSGLIEKYRGFQRDAREEAAFRREKDIFRSA